MSIVVLAHQKGGVGKTTTALNLAEIMKPDIIIDQDAHEGIAFLNEFRAPGKRFKVLSGLTKTDMITALKKSEEGQTILVDCGGFDSAVNRVAIALADVLLVPTNDDVKEVSGLRRFNQTLVEISQEMGFDQTGHVFITRVHPSRRKFDDIASYINNSSHLNLLNSRIPTRKWHNTANFDGLGVTAHKYTRDSEAAREVKALANEVKTLLEKN